MKLKPEAGSRFEEIDDSVIDGQQTVTYQPLYHVRVRYEFELPQDQTILDRVREHQIPITLRQFEGKTPEEAWRAYEEHIPQLERDMKAWVDEVESL